MTEIKKIDLKKAKAHEQDLLDDIKKAHAQGKPIQTHQAVRQYLKSFDTRCIAVHMAFKDMKRFRKFSPQFLPKIAEALNIWMGTDEKVTANWQPKENGSNQGRWTVDFGVKHRAQQWMVVQVLKVLADIHPNQFAVRNGGRNEAIKMAAKALEDGYRYVVEIDIKSCYPSFNPSKVVDLLPLPKEVTKKVIPMEGFNLSLGNVADWVGNDDAESIVEVRRGLPQGSSASPIVVEMLLAPIMNELPQGGVVLVYADNFLIMAKDENGAATIALALGSALNSHPAGPLWPNQPKIYFPHQAVEFLGYRLKMVKGKCEVSPTWKNTGKFDTEFVRRIKAISKVTAIEQQSKRVRDCTDYVRSWSGGFKLWDGHHAHTVLHMNKINKVAVALGVPPLKIPE